MFYDFQELIHVFLLLQGKTHHVSSSTLDPALVPALVPVPDPTLIPAPSIAQKRKASWRLWHWRPVMDKSGTWVFFMIAPSSY
jgi:hypothetical protein